jgi:hypothetical protein
MAEADVNFFEIQRLLLSLTLQMLTTNLQWRHDTRQNDI